eukprot:CAMPEP_0117024556 /NCGR_PEP_ID=MMETSP0472-20121206/18222_1 /TAXON_ID=693140 ORGANISM="Tiarina fusus, Strain LIS" /NCGR_SAMPLE_ID=MMETSP0472 /ASSEMBLY_ACC=CAM_ASM_000603 /LENGTH=404 /DNA_ID=CAMNT_0004731015 /DNA_START=24 /DNA_END=1238 /DNA_ORIENTATION=+
MEDDQHFDGEILEDEGIQEEILDTINQLVESGDAVLDDGNEDLESEEGDEEMDEDVPNEAKITLQYHTDAVYGISLRETEDSWTIGTGGGDEIGSVYHCTKSSLQNDEQIMIAQNPKELQGHSDSITSVAWNFDHSILATGGMDGMVQLWTPEGDLIVQLQGPADSIEWLDWHPRGNVIVCGSEDGTGWMWNNKGLCLNVFSGHDGPITCGRFTPDGKLLITGSRDESVKIWVPTQGTTQRNILGDLFHQAPILCFDCTDSVILSGAENGTLRLSNYISGKILSKYENHEDSVESVQFSSVLPIFTSASLDGLLKVWDLNSGQLRSTVLAHAGGVVKTKMHQSEPLLYSCGVDGTTKVWDIRSSTCVRTFQGHKRSVLDIDISKDGKTILTSSDDQTVRMFQWS